MIRTIPKNFQVFFGPPGTGKTTKLSDFAIRYAEYEGADTLMLTSFTKAAALELAGRDLSLTAGSIGTLHSHCYQGLDHPTIAESKTKDWNESFPRYPMATGGTASQVNDSAKTLHGLPDERAAHGESLLGDVLLSAYNLRRGALLPFSKADPVLRMFVKYWEDWKAQNGYLDFTDLLVRGLDVLKVAPGRPRTLMVDEAQDCTPLHWAVITQWSQHAVRTIAGGDDDQALYRWCGADATPLLAADATSKSVLPKSYRLPNAIYTYAQQYLQAIRTREPKTWTSNGLSGEQSDLGVSWRNPESLRSLIEQSLAMPERTLMILAPCSYMLEHIVTLLRREGIPFANPWRRRRGDWNPLFHGGRGVSSVTRLLDFLRAPDRLWTWRELGTWGAMIRTRPNLLPAAKALLTLNADDNTVCPLATLEKIFTPEALQGALNGGISWLETHILKQYATGMAFPLHVYQRFGRQVLVEDPRVMVGTCHSVKGGEADTVVLFRELSRAFQQARDSGGDDADSVERMLYVGATRARHVLYTA